MPTPCTHARLAALIWLHTNLIFNGVRVPRARNALLDVPLKLPGMTHPAFIVDDLKALQHWLEAQGILITEGPHHIGPRRIALFIRYGDAA